MAKTLMQQEVLNHFGIENFRQLRADQVTEFYSMMKDMDKEVAKEAIEQFPNFKEYGLGLFEELTKQYNSVIEAGKDSSKQAMASYSVILDSLKREFEKDNYTLEEKREIASMMIDVGDRIRSIDIDNKTFLLQVIKSITMAAGAVASIGAAVLGVKYKIPSRNSSKKQNPKA